MTLPVPDEAARDLYGRLRRFLTGAVLDIGCGTGSVAASLAGPSPADAPAGASPAGASPGGAAPAGASLAGASPAGLSPAGAPPTGPFAAGASPAGPAAARTLILLDAVDLRGPLAARFPFVLGDACALPFATGSLDGVHLARVLHHVSDWRLALAEALRVLRPGGSIALTLGGRMFASALSPLRDAVFDEGRRLGLRAAHHAHGGPSGYSDIDAVLGPSEVVEVRFPQYDTPRQVAFDAASHPYAWLQGQDLSPLRAVASDVLTRSGLDPDAPVSHERVISYRVYRKGE